MKGNRYVIVEELDHEKLIISRSRGKLTIDDICEALTVNDIEETFAIFIKGQRFVGWEAHDETPTAVVLHNINLNLSDICPCCAESWKEMRNKLYEDAYQDGYRAGLDGKV